MSRPKWDAGDMVSKLVKKIHFGPGFGQKGLTTAMLRTTCYMHILQKHENKDKDFFVSEMNAKI